MELVLLFIVIAISLCELMGQSCLKYFNTKDSKIHYYLLAIMFYAMVCYLLIQSYKYKGMGLVNVLWSGISILVILSGSAIFFGEEITTMDKVGVVMVILGIILIMYEENPHLPPFNKKQLAILLEKNCFIFIYYRLKSKLLKIYNNRRKRQQ